MRRLIHPNAMAVLIRNNEPRFQTLDNTIITLEKAEQELVETTWDEIEHVDDGGHEMGDMKGNGEGVFATVWTKFRIDMDGELYQLGSSSYSCWKDPEVGWIILSMADVARVVKRMSDA